ncbi:MAG TPA: methyltransferase domain-containing protein [Burkholderiales bacterium]|nr:methyltransferase domain-containing protein [Burkholderiales bacterium]
MRLRILLLATVFSATAWAQPAARTQVPDVIYVPTPYEVVDEMLKLAGVKKGDVLYDLGSGDGRIPVTAAKKLGIRAVGIDIDPQRIEEAKENARKNGVASLVQFRQEDLFRANLREATVVTLYLLPDLNVKLRPKLLAELKPGSRIVSHQFDMGTWKPDRKIELSGRTIYLWTVPARKP